MKLSVSLDGLRRFLSGKLYPAILALIVVAGHLSGLEYYGNILLFLSAGAALLLCDSIKPFLFPSIAFLYQISLKNTPADPTFSDYYFTPGRAIPALILFSFLLFAMVAFLVRHAKKKRRFLDTPLLLPLLLLAAAFLLSGVFSASYTPVGTFLGLCEALAFGFLFYLFYCGLSEDETEESLADWLGCVTALLSLVLIVELAAVWILPGSPLENGLAKESVLLGWGIWNTIGVSLVVLIPMNFYGFLTGNHPIRSLLLTFATAIASVLSLSRNAMLTAAILLFLCFFLSALRGSYKRASRVVLLAAILLSVGGALIFHEKVFPLLSAFFADNGRFELWKNGFDAFLSSPIFGAGFFGTGADTFVVVDFMPSFSHNTFVELLAATGAFGFLAYLFYRVSTLRPLLRRPTRLSLLLFVAVLGLLIESLLDNFVFYFYPMFYYNAALAAIFRLSERRETENPI